MVQKRPPDETLAMARGPKIPEQGGEVFTHAASEDLVRRVSCGYNRMIPP